MCQMRGIADGPSHLFTHVHGKPVNRDVFGMHIFSVLLCFNVAFFLPLPGEIIRFAAGYATFLRHNLMEWDIRTYSLSVSSLVLSRLVEQFYVESRTRPSTQWQQRQVDKIPKRNPNCNRVQETPAWCRTFFEWVTAVQQSESKSDLTTVTAAGRSGLAENLDTKSIELHKLWSTTEQ